MSEREQPSPRPMGMLQTPSQSGLNTPREFVDALSNNFGHLSLEQADARYVGSDHWATILGGVSSCQAHSTFSGYLTLVTYLDRGA
jgi:hypothetical protein